MTEHLDHAGTPAVTEYATAHLVFELSKAKWNLGGMVPVPHKISLYTIEGGDLKALTAGLGDRRAKAGRTGKPVRILSCFEAGLDGHWLHRWLTDEGVESHEVDAASIEVDRRA